MLILIISIVLQNLQTCILINDIFLCLQTCEIIFCNIDCKYRYIFICHHISSNCFYFEIKQNGPFKITSKNFN